MGFFGGSSKTVVTNVEPDPQESKERFDDLPALPKPLDTTVIAKGITITGHLQGEGLIQVEGTVEGEIDLQGSVSIMPTGIVKGPIDALAVRIAGTIEGNVTAHDRLRLEKTGVIDGDITTASLVIEAGGVLNGRTTMEKPNRKPAPEVVLKDELQFGPDYQAASEASTYTAT